MEDLKEMTLEEFETLYAEHIKWLEDNTQGGRLILQKVMIKFDLIGRNLKDSSFVDSRFEGSSFVRSSFEGSSFEGSSFVRSSFVDSSFVRSSFVDSSGVIYMDS